MKIEISIEKYYQSLLAELNLLPKQSELLRKIKIEYPDLKIKTINDVLSVHSSYFVKSINEPNEKKYREIEEYVKQNFTTPFFELKENFELGFDKWLLQSLQDSVSEIKDNCNLKSGKLYIFCEDNLVVSQPQSDRDIDDLSTVAENNEVKEDLYEETPLLMFDLSKYKFIKKINENPEIKAKLKINDESTIKDLFDIDEFMARAIPGLGNTYIESLILLKKDFQERCVYFNNCSQSRMQSIISLENTIEDIDDVLFEDIDNYLNFVLKNNKDIDIATSRWGYGEKQETLDLIGRRYGVTRESVRQHAKRLNINLLKNIRVSPDVLWKIISDNLTEELTDLLPNLFSCFDNEDNFYDFLDLCCGNNNGTIKTRLSVGDKSTDAINSLFCQYSSPISQEIINDKLIEEYGYTPESAIKEIKQLQLQGKIELTENGVFPKALGKKEAIAHALILEQNGLPWLDISRIINARGFSKTKFPEIKIDQFNTNDHVYLCGRGTFRHIKFIEFDMENEEKISQLMDMIRKYLTKNLDNNVALRLNEFYSENYPNIDYYILRHLVREFGEDYGIFFNGRNSVDSISLTSFTNEIRRISLADRLEEILEESITPMTKHQLALNLNINVNHVGYLMGKLTNESEKIKIVRVDNMRFTTPEKAFTRIDVEGVINVIKEIMEQSKIVEAEVFKEKVNQKFNYCYDKNFYVSLVKKDLNDLNWYRAGFLFSRYEIPYDSMTDACRKLCKRNLGNLENENLIKKHILLTNAVAANAVSQWRKILG